MLEEDAQKLSVMMAEISSKMQIILDKQEELADNIEKIKDAVYDPDKGLYARLKDLDTRILGLEKWKDSTTKLMWIVTTALVGLSVSTVWRVVF
jgi:predicted  nucleic acid-binding Zn-ribbon protein